MIIGIQSQICNNYLFIQLLKRHKSPCPLFLFYKLFVLENISCKMKKDHQGIDVDEEAESSSVGASREQVNQNFDSKNFLWLNVSYKSL